ncbi:MAG: hypothetical protein FWD55_06760 [Propionibacteriaceae bacterium]|nr:hypothetical protein [Propionibacteriaceae bacterium]
MAQLFPLLGFAFTGEVCDAGDACNDVAGFLAALEECGWSRERIRQLAHDRWDREEPYPYPLPAQALGELESVAAWFAILGEVRCALGLDVVQLAPSKRTDFTADELRLMGDVPPHHGSHG